MNSSVVTYEDLSVLPWVKAKSLVIMLSLPTVSIMAFSKSSANLTTSGVSSNLPL